MTSETRIRCCHATTTTLTREAVLGFFVVCENGLLYAITAKHVTGTSGGVIYCLNSNKDLVVLGTADSKVLNNCLCDIGLVRIVDSQRFNCNTVFRNIYGRLCIVRLYTGSTEQLYGKEMYIRTNARKCNLSDGTAGHNKEDIILEHRGSSDYTYTVKKVMCAVAEIQERFQRHKKGDEQFQINTEKEPTDQPKKDRSFVVISNVKVIGAGESGAAVFTQNTDGSVDIVGILAGEIGKDGLDTYLNCTLVGKVSTDFQEGLNSEFRLATERDVKSVQGALQPTIGPGSKIFIKLFTRCRTPEQIKKVDFELMEKITQLIRGFGLFENDVISAMKRKECEYELALSRSVHGAVDIRHHTLAEDSPDRACFHNCMVGCHYIYASDYRRAEKYLKEACRAVVTAVCKHRLLAKIVQLLTLIGAHSNDFGQIENLYDIVEEFMKSLDVKDPGVLRILGYFYMNMTWFFQSKGKRDVAIQLGRRSVDVFDRYSKNTYSEMQGPGIARITLARILLGCGCFMEMKDIFVNDEDMQEAEDNLQMVEWDVPKLPVLRTNYKLALSNLMFRKGLYEKSLEAAKECLKIANHHKLQLGAWIHQSEAHIVVLQCLCTGQKVDRS